MFVCLKWMLPPFLPLFVLKMGKPLSPQCCVLVYLFIFSSFFLFLVGLLGEGKYVRRAVFVRCSDDVSLWILFC